MKETVKKITLKESGQYPVDAHLGAIADALRHGATCLIKAEPGAGKTTRVPIHLLNSIAGDILVLEPRRLAARLSAERSAWFLGQPCGQTVGYRIRQDKKVSPETRLTFITEGLFSRLLMNNPELGGVGAVVIDEFHERNIHTDIALALARELQQTKRPDLKLVIMSATLDTASLEEYLGDARVFDIEGKMFPVEVEYIAAPADPGPRGPGGRRRRGPSHTASDDALCHAAKSMLDDPRCPGDILVFLTGIGEIMRAKSALEKTIGQNAEILPLASDLPFSRQQKVFQPCDRRKIVLSTNVAETSLTIPGITGVIDGGQAKIPGQAPWSGMPTLEIKRISRASAIQRAGRAGRVRNGLVYRLYSKPEYVNRDPFTPPDIQRIDISHALLEIMNLGYSPHLMPWFQPPADDNLESALQLLTYLGAVDSTGAITGLGKKLSLFPLHPRLAAVTLEGLKAGHGEDALLAACLISEGFVLRRNAFSPSDDEEGEPCDISMQLDLIKAAVHKKNNLSEYPPQFLDDTRQKRVVNLYRSLAGICRLPTLPPATKTDTKILSRCLLRGYPDRVARLRDMEKKKKDPKKKTKSGSALYNFCLGRGGMIGKNSFVLKKKPTFLVAVDAVESLKQDAAKGISIMACASLSRETLEEDPGGLLRRERREEPNPDTGVPEIWEGLYYGKLRVTRHKIGTPDQDEGLARILAQSWPFPFENDIPLKIYHHRVALLNKHGIPNNCAVFTGDMLEFFFQYICEGVASLDELKKKPLAEYIDQQLDQVDRTLLDSMTPLELKLRNGKRLTIRYEENKDPWGEILLQDCFGLKETPTILGGKQPVVLHLLGPNRRPAQVTSDLGGFWRGSYDMVRRELSRRYPKHHWPENPANAEPVPLKRMVKEKQ